VSAVCWHHKTPRQKASLLVKLLKGLQRRPSEVVSVDGHFRMAARPKIQKKPRQVGSARGNRTKTPLKAVKSGRVEKKKISPKKKTDKGMNIKQESPLQASPKKKVSPKKKTDKVMNIKQESPLQASPQKKVSPKKKTDKVMNIKQESPIQKSPIDFFKETSPITFFKETKDEKRSRHVPNRYNL
jgi:hypothetical protein